MKKILSMALVLVLALSCFVACGGNDVEEPKDDPAVKSEGVNTHAEYVAAKKGDKLTIEAYVQGKQSWWEDNGQGKASIYAQDKDGGYFLYELPCTEAEYNKLEKGTKIKVTGYRTEWSGEIELEFVDSNGAYVPNCFEIIDAKYVAPITDVTSILANATELIKHQNEYVAIKGVTVKALEYQGGARGKDIYVTVTLGEGEYSFCVESYLTSPDSDLYKAVEALKAGDKIDVEGFLYWYNGVNTHITSVVKK